MSSIEYINGLAARGIQLWVQDGKLQYKAPKDAITPALLGELKQHKATLIALIEQFAGTAGSYPLSYSQKSLWSLHRLNPDSAAYNVMYAARLDDALDVAALGRCVDYLIARHPILRTRYDVVDGQPQQQVSVQASARLVIDNVFDATDAAIHDWIDTEANRPFDLAASPIRMKLLVNTPRSETLVPRHVLLLNVHHIAADFWSLEILVRELRTLYGMALAQQPLRLPPLTLQYKDCVQDEIDRLQGAPGKALASFWENELQGIAPTLDLASDRPRPPVKTENGRVLSLALGEPMTRALKDAARSLQVTPYMLLLGVYQLFLFLHTGQSKFSIGAPTAGRNLPGSEQVLGHFVNAVVLACELRADEPFAEVLVRTRSMMLRAMDHQDYPFPLLVERMRPPRDASRSPVFQVMYNWNQVRSEAPAADGAAEPALIREMLAASSTGTRGATHDLTLNLQDYGAEYIAAWTFNTDLFDEATVARFAKQYVGLVEQVLVDARQPLSSYRMTAHTARAQVLERIAQAACTAEPVSPLPAVFFQRAGSHPQRLAWQVDGRALSYADVADAVRVLRTKLQAQGVAAGSVVGVRLASAAELSVALLALLEVDACPYLVDTRGADASDAEADSLPQPDAIVCGGSDQWAAWNPDTIAVTRDTHDPALRLGREDCTSAAQIGSFIDGIAQVLELDVSSRLLLLHGTDLRLAVATMVMTVVHGGSLCANPEASIDGLSSADPAVADRHAAMLADAIERHQATTLSLPALLLPIVASARLARLNVLLAYGEHPHALHPLLRDDERPAALRFLPAFCLASWAGPLAFAPSDAGWRLLPLAGPYPRPVVLGPFMDVADEHQAGRLHLLADRSPSTRRGQDLAARFRHHLDLANAFTHHRLVETPLHATRRPGGEIVCTHPSWRVATHRFAPFAVGPVESVIGAQPEVRHVACVVQDTPQGTTFAAHVQAQGDLPTAALEDALRRRLKQALPDYMHPQAFVFVDRLPLDTRGSLDAARLAVPQPKVAGARAAASDTERQLAEIWCEVLSLPAVGMDDDFFELGGDSILAAVIVSRASLAGLYLKPKDVFEHTTIAGLARVVSAVPQLQVDQGAVTGEVAPGPASAWFFDKVDADLSHFNQAMLLALRERPDAALMDETLRLVAEQHDVLRSRFVRSDTGWCQRFEPDGAVPPRLVVAPCIGPDGDTVADLWQEAIAAAQRSLDIEHGPLWTVRWLSAGTLADSRLLIVMHHLLVDGVSWSILLQDINDTYLRLQSHAAARLPPKTSSYKAWVEAWAAHARSDEMAAERSHWERFGERLRRVLVDGDGVALMRHSLTPAARRMPAGPVGSCAITLDAELSQAFRTTAHQAYGTDANDLLLAALYAGFHAWGGSRALLLDLEGHGRDPFAAAVDVSRSIGWFTSIYPVLLERHDVEQPGQLIKQVKQHLREIPRKGAGFGVLRYLAEANPALASLPASPVLFTYLGALDQIVGTTGLYTGVVEPAPGIRSTRQARTHLLDVYAYVSGGRLTLECSFDGAAAAEDSIGCLMQHIKDALTLLIRHCCSQGAGGLTPSDVPTIDIDQDALDALLEEVAALDTP
jgi:non-ribosomal peptide synthase protein (TIGR01720 family)